MGAQQTDPLHILLFEDNPADADLVAEYLDLSPLTTLLTVCKRLQEGLATLRNSCFEVVLLDLSLPDSKGLQTLDAVREFCADCAVIVLTGTDDEALSLRTLHAEAQDYLVKNSLNSDNLSRSIRYAVERAALNRQISRDRAELSQREHLLRLIFDASTEPMLILANDYTIRFFNPTAQRLLDADEDGLIGETFPFAINPDQGTELEIPEADGGSRLVELTSRELIWEGESGILVILRDVTDRSRSENELKLERQRLQAALDSIQEGILITDAAGRIERANHEACRLSGNEWPGIAGQPLSQVLRLRDAENGTPLRDPCRELLHRDSIETYRQKGLELEAADGSKRRLVSAICRPIEDTSGTHCGCVTVLRDITKDKKAEEELFRMEKLNSVSLLAGGIAHDFNNILTAILGNISVVRLQMPEEDENSQRLLNAENAAVQAKSLTQQLLTFSKGGAPVLEVTSIGPLIEESARFIMRGSNVKCEIERDPELWSVDADKGQIAQVVNNLIINADQAMPRGGRINLRMTNEQLRFGQVPTLQAGDYVAIEVRDTGAGIPPEAISRIFDPYYTTKDNGNGLGLASSSTIVQGHGGTITVDSELNEGTTFTVYLPRSRHRAAPDSPTPEPPEATQVDAPAPTTAGKRILVMDDMEDMMLVAGEILKVLGCEVTCTADGSEAIKAYKEAKEAGQPFDAVVFDLTVPGGMGGEEAGQILQEYDPSLRAIASSGYTTSNIMSDFRDSPFQAVVPKPYRIGEMRDALLRVLT